MYKKRFTKWGFQKNSRRSHMLERNSRDENMQAIARGRSAELVHINLRAPNLGQKDTLTLSLLTSVRTCGDAFFESVQPSPTSSARSILSQLANGEITLVDAKYVSFTFKLVTELLKRERGDLAGRMARRAFLSLDGILAIDDPVMVWNLLETMISLVTEQHIQLFFMLVSHVLVITGEHVPSSHPVPSMLRALQRLSGSVLEGEAQSRDGVIRPSGSSLAVSHRSDDGKPRHIDQDAICAQILPVLQQAWSYNAHKLLSNFDPALMQHYRYMLCEGCAINAPFISISPWMKVICDNDASPLESSIRADAGRWYLEEELVSGVTFRDRNEILETLREHFRSIVDDSANSGSQAKALMPTLGTLTVAKLLDTWVAATVQEIHHLPGSEIGKLYANNLATGLRTLTELEAGAGQHCLSPHVLKRGRQIVALSDHAHGRYSPQAVRELCLLEESLLAAGERVEAREVRQDIFHRSEILAESIPVDSA
jgi:hypothetical protein